MAEDVKEIKEEDLMVNFAHEDEKFKALSDTDKKFGYVQQAISTVHSINMISTNIRNVAMEISACIPSASREVVKIIASRCDDLNPNELNDISAGYIHQLLTVDGKTYELVCPDSIKSKIPLDVQELDKLNFNRSMIMAIKTSSENIATWTAWRDKLTEAFNEKVTDEIKAIVSSPDNLEKYITDYYKEKSVDARVPEEVRKRCAEILKWQEYAYTLQPIIESVKNTIRKSSSAKSIIHGYRNNARVTITDAAKVCKACGCTFPPHILATSIEIELFGETYKAYKYLLPYLVARYIKYLGNDMSDMQKIFITQLISVMMYITRGDAGTREIREKFSVGAKNLLNVIVTNI